MLGRNCSASSRASKQPTTVFSSRRFVEALWMRYRYNTSAIISPEVMEGGKYDSKVDTFSLGIIIVEMLTFLGPPPACVRHLLAICRTRTDMLI